MYCPKCGKELSAENLKFCSGCGLPVTGVKEILTEDGNASLPEEVRQEQDSLRLKGLRKGVKSLLVGVGLGIVGYLLGVAKLILDGRIPPADVTRELLIPLGYMAVACLLFLGPIFFLFGVVRIVYALALEKGLLIERRSFSQSDDGGDGAGRLKAGADRVALPLSEGVPVEVWQRSVNTSEIVAPPSVTDRTTKLLYHEDIKEE